VKPEYIFATGIFAIMHKLQILSYVFLLLGLLGYAPSALSSEYHYPAPKKTTSVPAASENSSQYPNKLRIFSTTDNEATHALILDFQKIYPRMSVTYHERQSLQIYEQLINDAKKGGSSADIAISSAMDLQMKLANDGYAHRIETNVQNTLPRWAVWRNEAFGTTLEPAVIIYHKPYFKDKTVPRNRSDLISFLENRPADLYGKIATYDIEKSGLGYMFLARDDSQFGGTWDLMRAMGLNGLRLYSQSSKIIEGVSSGQLKLGYNVLGSYAISQIKNNPDLGVILPEDYTTVFSRIAIVPKTANSPEAGRLFLEYLLSERGQRQINHNAQLNSIHPNVKNPNSLLNTLNNENSGLRPIKVGPGLLVYLDQMKRRNILKRWNKALYRP